MHTVAVLALQDVVPLDLIIPIEIFSRARTLNGKPCYRVTVCGPSKTLKGSLLSLGLHHSLASLPKADTIVIPGTEPVKTLPKSVREQLIRAHKRGVRIISICSGAFHLAETGLLDGRTATTHWMGAEEMQNRFPAINVNPNVLYVDEGQIMTSAGACAGIDLCLHVVRKDFGAAVAAQSARLAVMPLERAGGQAQHIVHATPSKAQGSLSRILEWIESHLEQELSLETIAEKACMSIRTLNRQFQKQTGTTPLKWILAARIKRARALLETTQNSMDDIASSVGFGSSVTMREHFRNSVHTNPKAYRQSFQRRP
jgi:transcriptional regulator GlxA family with amidase domain